MYLLTFVFSIKRDFSLSAQKPYIPLLKSPVGLTALFLRPRVVNPKVRQLILSGNFYSPQKQMNRASAETLNPAQPQVSA